MTELFLISVLLKLVAALVMILIVLVGWMGNKLYNRLGAIDERVLKGERRLYRRVNTTDQRVTILETRLNKGIPA